MQEELDQFQKNDVWKLVEFPKGKKAVGAKWSFSTNWMKMVRLYEIKQG